MIEPFNFLILAYVFRLIFITYGIIHDSIFYLKFTDIDYIVFTDGARYLQEGRSPFLRHGYRYSPVFSFFLYPNVYIFSFGKFLFTFFDVINGFLIFKILSHANVKLDKKVAKISSFLWLFNPFTMIISTRGSADSFITFQVLLMLLFLVKQKYILSGLTFGIVIHCKIYPAIYSLALYLFLSGKVNSKWSFRTWSPFHQKKILFFVSAICSFSLLTYLCYLKYGKLYIKEAWMYHLHRQDVNHNFSPYFFIYRMLEKKNFQSTLSLIAFIPQFFSNLYYSVNYCIQTKDSNLANFWFALFSQTYFFVSLNKVATSQYFLWYLCLLPLIYPFLNLTLKQSIFMVGLWLSGQVVWLFFAYLYQFLKFNVLFYVWLCSLLFLLINIYLQIQLQLAFKSPAKKLT